MLELVHSMLLSRQQLSYCIISATIVMYIHFKCFPTHHKHDEMELTATKQN